MSKADRVLGLFPAFYRASDATKLLADVVRALCGPIEEADTLLFRIQRAHRINVAEDAGDIVRLAGLLNLDAVHFEDILTDQARPYEQKLELMRERVRRIARVHLNGLGTPWAVLEAAAIFLDAAIVPERPGDPLIKHLDAEGYSHKAVVELAGLPEKPREVLYLHEGPLRRQKVEPAERWQLNSWTVENRGAEASPVRIVIEAVGDRTVRPSVFCPATEAGVFYDGEVPPNKTLIIDGYEGASIDGESVEESVVYFRGGLADFSREGQAVFAERSHRPRASSGSSEWRFKVALGIYDGADFDLAAFPTPEEPIGVWDGDFTLDACVYDYPASGVVGMAWDERLACAFKLLLPPRLPEAVSRVGGILPRFKAAGIRAFVDSARDAWILGSSVLRDAQAASGEGVELHATRVVNPRAELFVT